MKFQLLTETSPRLDHWILVRPLVFLVAIASGMIIVTQPVSIALTIVAAALLLITLPFSPITAVTLLLVLAPLRTLIATESPGTMPFEIGQLLFVLTLAVWFVYRVARRQSLIYTGFSLVYVPPGLIIASLLPGILNASSLGAWLADCIKWVSMFVLVVFCLSNGRGRQWQWFAFSLALAGAANAIVGIYIFLGGSGALHLLINGRFFRAFGTFGQPNPFGGFMGLLLPVVASMALGYLFLVTRDLYVSRRTNLARLTWLAFYMTTSALILAGVVVSWSRGAWLGVGTSFAVMLFALPRRLLHGAILIGLVGIVFAGLWQRGLIPASLQDRITSSTAEVFTLSDVRAVDITPDNYPIVERLAHWQAALNMARHNFWFGVGAGNYDVAYEEHRLANWPEALGHAHNFYLNVFAEAGIIGLTAYLVAMGLLLIITWRIRRHPDTLARTLGVGLIGTWVYLLTHSTTDNLYVNNIFLHMGVMLGLLAVLDQEITPMRVD